MAHRPPATNETIIDWEPVIRKIGLDKGVPAHEIDDFAATIYIEWIEGDYTNKYDPSKGAFTTYFWAFVGTRAMRDRDKHTRWTKPTTEAEMGDEPGEDEGGSWTVTPADPVDPYELSEQNRQLESILTDLKRTSPVLEVITHTIRTAEGTTRELTIERSLYTLARLLLWGYSHRDIAKIYKRSVGTVSNMISRLRAHPTITQAVLGVHPYPKELRTNGQPKPKARKAKPQ